MHQIVAGRPLLGKREAVAPFRDGHILISYEKLLYILYKGN